MQGSGFRVQSSGFRVCLSGFRVSWLSGQWFKPSQLLCRVSQ